MASFSGKVTVTKEPRISQMPTGDKVVSFNAVCNLYDSKAKAEEPWWVSVTIFKPSDYLLQNLTKGTSLNISNGSIGVESWTTREGAKQTTTTIKVSFPYSEVGIMRLSNTATGYPQVQPIYDESQIPF